MAEQEEMFETAEVVAAEDTLDSIFKERTSVVSFVKERYKRSEDSRYADEKRLINVRRWPQKPTIDLMKFIALK